MNISSPSNPAKLPVWPTIKASYVALLRHPEALKRVALFSILPTTIGTVIAGEDPMWIWFFVQMIFAAIGAVIWHRALLAEASGDALTEQLPRASMRYYAVTLILWLWFFLPVMAISLWAAADTSPMTDVVPTETPASSAGRLCDIAIYAGIATILFLVALANRASVVLPAIAIGNDAVGFRAVWQATRGNTLRMFVVLLAVLVPALVPFLGVWSPLPEAPSTVAKLASSGIQSIIGDIGVLIGVGALSYSYRHFFPRVAEAA